LRARRIAGDPPADVAVRLGRGFIRALLAARTQPVNDQTDEATLVGGRVTTCGAGVAQDRAGGDTQRGCGRPRRLQRAIGGLPFFMRNGMRHHLADR
jgi:hypothetical protein